MGGSTTPWHVPYMNYRAWNLKTMKALTTGVPEPEAAGAIAWILYNAFLETGNEKFRIGSEWALEFLNNWPANPSYELQLGYGVYTAARMNAELGTNYNIQKLINWCFDIGALRNWGCIIGNWGGYDVHGLIGEIIDNEYAFIMNGFELAGALVPLVRYDDRFARAIGKWILNLSNASRLFYTNYLPDNHQDSEEWAHQYDPNSFIAHEALRETQNGVSPYATGDAISGGWGQTNLALYSSSHAGILGGIIDTTNVEGILKLDLLKTDYFHNDSYPSYLLYNPYDSIVNISMNIGSGIQNIYDAVSNSFIQNNVSGQVSIEVPADGALIVLLTPSGGAISYDLNKTLINNVIVDYNNGLAVTNFPPRIKSLSSNPQEILMNSSAKVYCTAEDKDNDNLIYTWSSDGGTISGNGTEITFYAPPINGDFHIKCIVDDGKGKMDSAEVIIRVVQSFNYNPVIERIKAVPRKIDLGETSVIKCFAYDLNNDTLIYNWSASGGVINGNSSEVIWNAPNSAGNYLIKCSVDDQNGGTDSDSIFVSVRDFSISQSGNLAAYYPFNGNANDESGNGNNGFVYQAVLTSDRFGNPGKAYYFDGINDYIQVQNNFSLNFQNSITINFWMQPAEFFEREAYPISHGNWENRWKISITNKKIRWTIKTTSGIKDLDSESELVLDSLYNVTAIYDGNDFEVYLNGELDAFSTFTGNILTTNIDLIFAQVLPGSSSYNFKGILDDIRIYNYALSYPEVKSLYDINTDITENNQLTSVDNFLYQNYPNPFNNESVIKFSLTRRAYLSLTIYDMLGRQIKTIAQKEFEKGIYSFVWDSSDRFGKPVSSGIYFYELKSENFLITKKLILLK
jgi:hypothetical protein